MKEILKKLKATIKEVAETEAKAREEFEKGNDSLEIRSTILKCEGELEKLYTHKNKIMRELAK